MVSRVPHETGRPLLRVGLVGILALFVYSWASGRRANLAIEPAPLPMLAPPPSPKRHREFEYLRRLKEPESEHPSISRQSTQH